MANSKGLTDDQLVATLQAGIRQSVGYSDSRLSKERLRVQRYLNGELPRPLHPGNSKYVSLDVWDTHECMKAQLLEVFSGNGQPVTFAPHGPDDVEDAHDATEVVTQVIMRDNKGYSVFRDVIDDGLSGRAGVVKIWWEERHEDEEMEFSNQTLQALEGLLGQNPNIEIKSLELAQGDETTINRAVLKIKKDKSCVRLKPLPPEEFFIAPRSTGLDTSELCGHRYQKTVSELIKDGYDKATVMKLRDNDSVWMATEPELIERHEQTDDIISDRLLETGQDAGRTCTLYECYALLDVDGDGESELWQVMMVADQILRKDRVERRPFKTFVPLPRPHAFWGTNFDEISIPTQNARTALTRSIIDHALITTNPRYGVVKGSLTNPRELMENRIGGIVNVSRPDGIFPLPQASLNPFVFQTIGQLSADKEERTGISQLSQGLNKDALSKQNSADMVEQLISMSQVRQKIVARNFAEEFLGPLYLHVYKLVIENMGQAELVEIAGAWKQVDPTSWPERNKLIVQFTLGYGEAEKEAQKFVMIDKYLTQSANRLYGETQRYNTIRKALNGMGIKDVDTYVQDPSKLPPAQPSPAEQADLQVKLSDAKVKEAQAAAAQQKAQLEVQQMSLEQQKLQLEQMKVQAQIQLENDKLAHKVAIDAAELRFQQEAATADKLQAFAAPTH